MWFHIDDDKVEDVEAALRAGGESAVADRLKEAVAASRDPRVPVFLARAREEYAEEGDLEFDDSATISGADENDNTGAYVMAWKWVPLRFCREPKHGAPCPWDGCAACQEECAEPGASEET